MRKFWIKNAKGEIFDMNREDAFFSKPKGLGISRKTTYEQLGVVFEAKKSLLSQKKPSGEMVFDGYKQYEEFLNVVRHIPLTLIYQPINELFYMEVYSFSLEKGEIDYKDGLLKCKVTFEGVTPWYKSTEISMSKDGDSGKTYSYKYPFTYADSKSGEVNIRNNSNEEAYCSLRIYGPVKNPIWKLTKGEKILLEGRIFAEIKTGNYLVVNSNPKKLEIAEYNNYGLLVKDLYANSDFATSRFIYAPTGLTKLKISHEGVGDIKFLVEVMEFAG